MLFISERMQSSAVKLDEDMCDTSSTPEEYCAVTSVGQ